ncbi:MAG: diguanylate cyclase [Vicinamibacterales bacterium]
MYPIQVALLGAEALVMAMLILALFRSRTVLGLSPLYIVLGGFQYLEASLGLRVEVAPGWLIYPASTVMFTSTLLAVLLVYIKEETTEARKLVYGLVLANIGLTLVALIVSEHVRIPGSRVPEGLTTSSLQASAWVAAVGTTLLLLDVLGIILVFEFVSRFVRSLFVRSLISLVMVAAFDNAWFTLLVHGPTNPQFQPLLLAGLVGKSAAAAFYAVALYVYLRFFEPNGATVGTGDVQDVFEVLTYRQRYEEVRQRMVRDALTGLYNRGYLDEILPRAVAHAARYQEPLSLLLVDTDHFKTINDTHSHIVGDRVLKVVAETLGEHARAADTVCRFGGDEFIVILSSADASAASTFAERFRRRLRERVSAASPPLPVHQVTATVGIATYLEDDVVTADDLVKLADSRLYVGKRAGRDRVVWHDLPTSA